MWLIQVFSFEENDQFKSVRKCINEAINEAIELKPLTKIQKKDGNLALFLYINNTIPNSDQILSDIYAKHKASDGFLYITYAELDIFWKMCVLSYCLSIILVIYD
jgi:hypothetical protein